MASGWTNRDGVSPARSTRTTGQPRRLQLAAVVGAAAVVAIQPMLPFALACAASAMMYVVIEELIPESQQGGYGDLATVAALVGFVIMMVLDVAVG